MCRLFGLSAGSRAVHATFWLLDAPDSLEAQGRRNPDGTGLGYFDPSGAPVVDKQAEPAYADVEFISDAKTAVSPTFVGHVRIATTGRLTEANTHPFAVDGRIMAHNGGFEDLDVLEAELGPAMDGVHGDTDTERYVALVAREIARADGDVGAGVVSAVRWLAGHVALYSLNMVLVTPTDLWALRYPDHNQLHLLHRGAGGHRGGALDASGTHLRVSSDHLADHPAVVVASEPMDDDPGWRPMESGELVHVDRRLEVTSEIVLPDPPVRWAVDPLA